MTQRPDIHNHCLKCNSEKYERKTFRELKQLCFVSKRILQSSVVHLNSETEHFDNKLAEQLTIRCSYILYMARDANSPAYS